MRPLILILGPTAGGKTSLSITLAQQLKGGGACICADSMQIYRGMNIGTATPTNEEQAGVPHHLLNIADPSKDGFTVEKWLTRANSTIKDIQADSMWPIVVGGTNLYIQSLLFGMFDGPKSDPNIRADLESSTNAELHEQLQTFDQDAATRIHINDRRRMVRAIEVFKLTGEPLSQLQSQWEQETPLNDTIVIGLAWEVEAINRRINIRVKEMMAQGLLDEVRALQGTLGMQAREALGYKQLLAHISGECTLDEAIEQIKILTRRFAKQQRNWLRRFQKLPNAHFIEVSEMPSQDIVNKALACISAA